MNASMNNAQYTAAGVDARDLIPALPVAALEAAGDATEIRFATSECALGTILVAQSARGLCAILIGDQPQVLEVDLRARFPHAQLSRGDADLEQLAARVVAFVEAPTGGLELPLDLRGTPFQRRVWQALRAIPAGHTATYAEIARRIGAPQAVRAVAGACAANPLAVVVPCHRVVRSDGALSGYRWGVPRKRALLESEARALRAAEGRA
jgi:AraC family transcriptional regulator of adaptative response/methylated-DNA-[protein]-cysteine methyltransferase